MGMPAKLIVFGARRAYAKPCRNNKYARTDGTLKKLHGELTVPNIKTSFTVLELEKYISDTQTD